MVLVNAAIQSRDTHRPGVTQPMCVFRFKLMLSVQSGLSVAVATINWSSFAGLERHFGFFAALGTYHGVHLPRGPVAAISVTLCFPGFTA